MPFIYIDSQGREVKIPSVDALRLRIELGAIGDVTQFHDENSGRWAPAVEHDIYRTLKRELDSLESSGFVAPPPPTPDTPTAAAEDPASPEAGPDAAGAEVPEERADPAEPGSLEPTPPEAATSPPGLPDHEADIDLADPFAMDLGIAPSQAVTPPEEVPDGPAAGDVEDDEDDGFDVSPLWDDEPDLDLEAEGEPPASVGAAGPAPAEPPEAAAPAPEAPTPEPPAPPPPEERLVASAEEELMGSVPPSDGGVGEDSGLTLEPSLAESFDAPPPVDEDPEDVPDWMSDPGEVTVEPLASEPVAADPADSWRAEEELRSEPVSRPRSAPPPRKLTRARSPGAQGVAGLLLLVVVVGAAAVFGWRYLSPLLGGGDPPEPEIALPALDEALVPSFRAMAGGAASEMSAAFLSLPERADIPGEPSQDWLAGIYLANASDYANIPAYWEAVREWVDAARDSEMSAFREALRSEVDASDLSAPDAEAVRNRALTGFQAASTDRQAVYDQLRAVADRALALHEFLLANEAQVVYEPAASGVSRDPVLEAVPATVELGDAMWDRVGAITNAMDALGYLDQIDTDRLLAAFLEKLEASAVR